MYAVYILSCLVAFVIHSSHGELPDSIKYSCIASSNSIAETNQILIERDQLKDVTHIYAYIVNNIWAECKTDSDLKHFIILGCWNFDVIVAPRNSSFVIIGGRESKLYQLKCVGPETKHSNVTVDISQAIKYAGSANVYGMDIVNAYGFDMIILDHHNQTKDTFVIGDLMIMQIIPKGDHQNTQWRVLSCTAYSAPVEIEFVKDANVLQDTRIVGKQQNDSQALYQIQLYAFHGVHNNEVTYTCTIDICLEEVDGSRCMGTTTTLRTSSSSSSSSSSLTTTTGTTTTLRTSSSSSSSSSSLTTTTIPKPRHRRRRRSADDYPTIHTAKVKIHVYDRTEDMPASGAFQSSLSMTMICGASLLMWIYK